jgi:hypothetical protein
MIVKNYYTAHVQTIVQEGRNSITRTTLLAINITSNCPSAYCNDSDSKIFAQGLYRGLLISTKSHVTNFFSERDSPAMFD